MSSVYINAVSKFLPNHPVANEEMEIYLGMIGNQSSLAKRMVLARNKIQTRYYAIDKNGNATHSNAEMTALAVKNLLNQNSIQNQIQLLSCGTTSPDQLLPSHASMVHGLLDFSGCLEPASFAGACCTGMQALKYGFMSVASGNSENAVCTGSERLSSWLRSENYEPEAKNLSRLEKNGYVAFEKEFLRWMLSDGAGAAFLENKKNGNISLKIDWIEITSFAHQVKTCMYAGAEKLKDGNIKGWHEYNPNYIAMHSLMSLQQDVKLLGCNIVELGQVFLSALIKKYSLNLNDLDYFLPHLSSYFFRDKIEAELIRSGNKIPAEKWFTNLDRVGNVGSASPYLMLEELMNSGKLIKGQNILMMIPESARFSYSYCHLTVC